QVPVGLVLCGVAVWTANRKIHLGIVLLHLAYQLSWITRLFYINA
ncbi:MAG: hypothetical protein ACI9GK_003571, partial [Devosia sp.]